MSLFKTLSRRGTRNQPAFDEGDDGFSHYDETPTNAAPRSSATPRKTLDRPPPARQQSSRTNQPTFGEGEDDGGVSHRATTTSAGSVTRKTLDHASSSRSSRNQPAFDEGFDDGGVSSYRATTKNSERKALDRSSSSRSSRNQPAFDEGGDGNGFSTTTTTTSTERPSLTKRASNRPPPSFRPSSRRNTPLALGTVRYVNYNARAQHGSLSKALDTARSTGKPILCHFVPPDAHSLNEHEHPTTTAAAAVFSDPQMVAVIEECFVPAAFITTDRTDPAVKRYAGERGILSEHYLRIVSPDGQRVVVGLGGHYNSKDHDDDNNNNRHDDDGDFWCTKETLQCTLVQALEQLGRHVPNALLRVRCTQREERVDP